MFIVEQKGVNNFFQLQYLNYLIIFLSLILTSILFVICGLLYTVVVEPRRFRSKTEVICSVQFHHENTMRVGIAYHIMHAGSMCWV